MNILTRETNKATIVDVAKMAGVSIKTVSRVANGQPHVRDKTRARVQRAIDLLEYSANPYAQHMGTQSRPSARTRRSSVVVSQGIATTEDKRQENIKIAGISAGHVQRDSATSNSDGDIDWW